MLTGGFYGIFIRIIYKGKRFINMDLEESLLALKSGEAEALGSVYDLTKCLVYSCAFALVKDHFAAEDLMQETYLKIRQNIPGYKSKGTGKAWICRIVRNLALDQKRRNKKTVPIAGYENTLAGSENKTKQEFDDIIETAKEILDGQELEIILLRTVGDLDHKEISDVLKLPYATARWKYANAVEKLKKHLERRDNP